MKYKLLNQNQEWKVLKTKLIVLSFFCSILIILTGCSKDEDNSLVGQDGNPRFNLTFTNHQNVDLDLYVKAPNGTVIYYGNPSGAGGTLDVDCMCSSCSRGPNENIFWVNGTAPNGNYEYWVKYYSSCGSSSGASSSFTLRVIKNGRIIATQTGTLSSGTSQIYTHTQD